MPPMQASTQFVNSPQTFPQSSEALDAVLGRFQQWTSSRKAAGDQDVRQLSYEEALKSTERRFHAAKSRTASGRLKREPGVIPVAAPSVAPVEPKDKPSQPAKKSAPAPVKPRSGAAGKRAAERKPHPAKPETEFRKVLAATIAPPPQPQSKPSALAHAPLPKTDRQVSLSLRLAPAEQAMIRARASAAGISTSAYLRQCALEVEQLREQMRHALALIGQGAALAVSNSHVTVQAPPPGFLEWLKRVFLGGKQARSFVLRA